MLRYITDDGQKIAAPNYTNVIDQLRSASWGGAKATRQAYMRAMASRVKKQSGVGIKVDTPANFVRGLLEIGYLKEDENNA